MKKIYLIVLVLLLTACSHTTDRRPSSDVAEAPQAVVQHFANTEIEEFQNLAEESLVWRDKSIQFYDQHKKNFSKTTNLSHEEIIDIINTAKYYLELRTRTLAYIDPNKELLDETNFYRSDLDRETVLKIKLGMAGALLLYDNYMIGVYPYQDQKKLRKILNQDVPGLAFELESISNNYFKFENRKRLLTAIKFFKKDLLHQKEISYRPSAEETYLEDLILQSSFYHFMADRVNPPVKKPSSLRVAEESIVDRLAFIKDSFVFTLSKIFGNTAGSFQSRSGKLYAMSEEEKLAVKTDLKPLDILLEKTPFRLTDRFIPGYYGHVAIWIGNEEELKNLGIWDHPLIAKFQDEIKSGHQIIEALRPGVQINKLEHFLDIDDMLVLRDQKLTDDQRKEFIIRAFQQIGKEYDFNFDVETDSKIVCSEIVYVVFHDIKWPTARSMGRFTISPDNVASKVQGEDPFLVPILMYKDGKKQQAPLLPKVIELLGK
jgi:hypothetical protein